MVTITEDYCSQEVYILLREKGFDGEIHTTFDKEGYTQASVTLQMAMKWLLKKHNIFICVLFLEESIGFGYTIENIITKKYIATSKNSSYNEPEEACEAAIKYCLENLI